MRRLLSRKALYAPLAPPPGAASLAARQPHPAGASERFRRPQHDLPGRIRDPALVLFPSFLKPNPARGRSIIEKAGRDGQPYGRS